MPQGSDIDQKKWFQNKGKGPSLIDIADTVNRMKKDIKELTEKLNYIVEKISENEERNKSL